MPSTAWSRYECICQCDGRTTYAASALPYCFRRLANPLRAVILDADLACASVSIPDRPPSGGERLDCFSSESGCGLWFLAVRWLRYSPV